MQFVDIQYSSPLQLSHFELGSKIFDLSYFFRVQLIFSKKKTISFFPVCFIANLVPNSDDDSSQLSFEKYYVSVARKLTII